MKGSLASPRKICFLVPSYFSANNGGAEYQVRLIIDALKRNGEFEIYYICRYVDPSFVSDYQIYRIGNGKKTGGFGKFGLLFDSADVYRMLKRIRPDVIYQRVGCAYTGIAAFYAKKNNARLIWHISSDSEIEDSSPFSLLKISRYPSLMLFKYGVRNANTIIGQTHHQDELLKKSFGRRCDVVIPNGHPCPEMRVEKKERITVLWISNMKPLKQPELFVRLTRELSDLENVMFLMLGRPGSGNWFEELLAEIKSLPNLEYLGEVSNEEVNLRLDEGHILVNTSAYEGFPNTFIQAWMRRVPVVSLQVDPDDILVREKIGFHSRTFDNLCKDLKCLIEDRQLREAMGERARAYACENHSIEKMNAEIIKLFE